jgi:ribose transport system substrate-binding protein
MRASTRKRVGVAVAAATVALAAAATGFAADVIGDANPVASNPNQLAITKGEQQAAKAYGWSVKTLDANLSPDKQVSDVDAFISLKTKGIIIWTLDPGAVGAAYKRAQAAGIPVVDFGSQQNVTSTVFDERGLGCSMGQKAADYIAKRVDKGAKVLAIGGPPVPSIVNYTNCFVKAAKAKGLVVADKQDNVKDTAATAQPIVQDMLTKNPDVAAIWAYNDPSALGAGAVVRSSGKQVYVEGKTDGIIVMGANGSNDAAAGIKSGVISATWDPQSPEMGRVAVEILAQNLVKKVALAKLPKLVVVPMKVWDASNISGYVDPLKRKVATKAPIPKAWIKK